MKLVCSCREALAEKAAEHYGLKAAAQLLPEDGFIKM